MVTGRGALASLGGVIATGAPAHGLRLADPGCLAGALADALSGGPPVAPLPAESTERQRVVEMLQPDRAVVQADAAVVVATSGSTGQPKGVVLSRPAIRASVTATHARLGGGGSWLLALPEHYVAGLMVVARAVLAGTGCHRVGSDLAGLAGVVAQLDGRRYISLVPTQLVRALGDPNTVAALATCDAILLGGGPADPHLLATAHDHQLHVVTTYGMSETCGGCVYDGVPLDGVDVDLDPDGQIFIAGPVLFSGYHHAPELTRPSLGEHGFRTSDRGAWVDGRLLLTGRTDQVIISGGLNVDLGEVERVASAWTALAGAELVIIGVPDADWGTMVVAVTDASDTFITAEGLRQQVETRLPPYAAPRRLVHVGTLPRTTNGKLDRQRLVRDLMPTRAPSPPPPRDATGNRP